MAINEYYWYEGKNGLCPFDSYRLGDPVPAFKSDSGTRLNVQRCPLCHKQFVEYRPDLDCLNFKTGERGQYVSCRFLRPSTRSIIRRQREEEEERNNHYEPLPEEFLCYRLLVEKFDISEEAFCECFDADSEEYQYFADNFRQKGKPLIPLKRALDYQGIPEDVRVRLKEYLRLVKDRKKAKEVADYFKQEYLDENGDGFVLDEEQALAVGLNSKYILTQARAGSGKTRALSSKIVYLIDHEHCPVSGILALAFNKDVPKSINNRVSQLLVQKSLLGEEETVDIAKTFHKVARDIVRPRGEIITGGNRTAFIQAVINDLSARNPWFKVKVYEAFRKENFQIGGREYKDEEDMYASIRGAQYETLNGETVKSLGEKWIADYLFEHGVKYEYEPTFYPSYIQASAFSDPQQGQAVTQFLDRNSFYDQGRLKRKTLKPDFRLPDYQLVWEHWGIDENSPPEDDKLFESGDSSWSDYHEQMLWKREFWNADWKRELRTRSLLNSPGKASYHLNAMAEVRGLLETSIVDMREGREQFEAALDAMLNKNRIPHAKRDQEELIAEAWEKQIKRFTKMMETFIDKYEQKYPDHNHVAFKKKIAEYEASERASDFLKLAYLVMKRYQKVLREPRKPKRYEDFSKYSCDFNQLLAEATGVVRSGREDQRFSRLQYLLIDEYQDFSDLFYNFVDSILKRNPAIKLFCVGDNWQAINRFMGADTHYYDHFEECFPSARLLDISTNYRCQTSIIRSSNYFMKASGYTEKPAVAFKTDKGHVATYDVNTMFLAMREDFPSYESDSKLFMFFSADRRVSPDMARYLKLLVQIAQWHQGESILLLSRTQKFGGHYELPVLERCLKRFLRDEYAFEEDQLKEIRAMTMHASKGLEADVVVVLECNEGMIPKIHPDSELYYIFGESAELNYQDEEKLFYVALTRAKSDVYLTYDQSPSPFLKTLQNGNVCLRLVITN